MHTYGGGGCWWMPSPDGHSQMEVGEWYYYYNNINNIILYNRYTTPQKNTYALV